MKHRRGISLAELCIAIALVAVVGIPILSVLATTDHEAMTSEDYMQAEALAERELAHALATPWPELEAHLPVERDIQGGTRGLRGHLSMTKIADGLISISVELEWPVRPGSPATRRYGLVRFRARPDQSIRTPYPFGE